MITICQTIINLKRSENTIIFHFPTGRKFGNMKIMKMNPYIIIEHNKKKNSNDYQMLPLRFVVYIVRVLNERQYNKIIIFVQQIYIYILYNGRSIFHSFIYNATCFCLGKNILLLHKFIYLYRFLLGTGFTWDAKHKSVAKPLVGNIVERA